MTDKRLIIMPRMWPRTLQGCPPGFFVFDGQLCFKTEYSLTFNERHGYSQAFCSSGEVFWGGTHSPDMREKLTVQPVMTEWEEVDG